MSTANPALSPSTPPTTPPTTPPLWLAWAATPRRAMAISLVVSVAVLGGALGLNGLGVIGWHAAVRATAVFAYPFWLLAYTAGPLARLTPAPSTRAIRKRRRAIGLAYFVAQYVHLAAIVGLARVEPVLLEDPVAIYGGGFGFLMIGLMALTSNDAAVKRLGGKAWSRLHGLGQLTVAIIYLSSYGGRIAEDLAYWPAFTLLLGAYGLRAAAAIQTRRRG